MLGKMDGRLFCAGNMQAATDLALKIMEGSRGKS